MATKVVISGTQSGSGKTLISLAIMAALTRRGLNVQPFKCGPDFIDPGLHKAVTGNSSKNLDGWMLGQAACIEIFNTAMYPDDKAQPDIAVIEGVMGLYDGASGKSDAGSTAQIAKWLDAPVLLVIDGRSMARSFAAIAHGFTTLDPDIAFAGCIANKVGSENHKSLISEAMQTYCPEISLAGCMPRNENLTIPSRHLGLVTAEEGVLSFQRINLLAQWAEESLDLDELLYSLPQHSASAPHKTIPHPVIRLGVAQDNAFCFCYPDNLRLLEQAGAELVPFSPLDDAKLPENLDGLYLPGGYPELYAERLSLNASMRSDIATFSNKGKPVYAECGGFMYLSQSITTKGSTYPMCGVFSTQCTMDKRFRALGYRQVTTTADTILGGKGTIARGHEFHYSFTDAPSEYNSIYTVTDRKNQQTDTAGFYTKNTLGSYVHLHFASQPELAKALIQACLKHKEP